MAIEEASHTVSGLPHPVGTDKVLGPTQDVGFAAGKHPPRALCRCRAAAEKVQLRRKQQGGGLQPAQLRVAKGLRRPR